MTNHFPSSPEDLSGAKERLTGFGGWLWWVAFGLVAGCVDAGVYWGAHLLPMMLNGDAALLIRKNAVWGVELAYELATHTFFLVYPLVLLLRCLRHQQSFVSGMIFYYIANLTINLGAFGLATAIPTLFEQKLSYYKSIAQAIVICAVWIPYFRRSVRVRHTFTMNESRRPRLPRRDKRKKQPPQRRDDRHEKVSGK